ncbi:hypothetical protein [Endozoicomonas montiporae]|uniref:Uncharacterized protein n=1 Tax=Endozoicomonas montiporae CL-33 TaxID=570277 RepID=A0A142BDZ6_9GAMM|nr:hypothetical protein [Endozoicomonas montiporae]AMO56972.1 hypothetical protein EZMO1_2932 [Endozoicomonas montiporae CL-33]
MVFHGVTRQICQRRRVPLTEINSGYCYDWARLALQYCPSAQLFYIRRLVPHAFIYFSGQWFDAQAPSGVRHWRLLPLLKPYRELFQSKDLVCWQPGDGYWHKKLRL